jgi:phosphotransferase system HPr-like phosphotransfer protein
MEKYRILYCDKFPENDVVKSLSEHFRVDTFGHLHNDPSAEIRAALKANDRYRGIVTHLPWRDNGSGGADYGHTARLITSIKLIDLDLRLVGYTGMGPNYHAKVMMYDSGVEAIFDRTRNTAEDARLIVSAMTQLLGEPLTDYGQEKPVLREEGGYTVADTVSNFFGCMGFGEWGSIMLLLKDKKRDVLFVNNQTKHECHWRDPMELLSLEICRGTPVTVKVEGNDELSRDIASQVCSAFAARHSFTVTFDKFSPKPNPA